ncbi:MAG TPA: sugar phosphate isomerase/epimerase family protein [bacterium]|nr:sugar phosphate isomerase/epimerase family protein [bacterium]HOM26961.1 sugar phosphate isomerase/epimerase family protein [bacterium]
MRIGFMMSYDKERVEFAKKVGFKSCELRVGVNDDFFPGKDGWETKAKEVVEYYKANDIRISCLAGFYVNHMDPEKEEDYKKLVRNVIILAEKMGVPVVAGFSGRIVGKPLEESIQKFVEIWSEHAKFAEAHGVKIAFEHCPMGYFHTPCNGINFMSTPKMWEIGFSEVKSEAIGLEWDPSHLICQFIDPVITIRDFGKRIYHVHAKDAHINWDIVKKYGIWHHGAIEHCFPGLGDTDWRLCIKELIRAGYKNDLNIEGWHDAVYHDRVAKGKEDEGLIIAFRHLSQFVVQD